MIKLKIKKGDEVQIIAGKDKGKKGKVIEVIVKSLKVRVAGVNVVKKHLKPSKTNSGGVISKELPIDISNVAHIDPVSGLPTKVGYKFLEDGKKVRISKRSRTVL